LSLEEAVATALRESPLLGAAEQEVRMAGAMTRSMQAMTRPTLSTTTYLSTANMSMILGTPAPVLPSSTGMLPDRTAWDQNVMAMLPLSTGGRLSGLVGGARSQFRAAQADLTTMRLDVALATRVAYRQVLLAAAVVKIYEELVQTNEERLRIDRVALEVGKIPQFNVFRDEAELADARQKLIEARRDHDLSLVSLRTVMGVHPASEISVAGELPFAAFTGTLEEALAAAEERRPELAAIRHRIAAGQQDVKVAKSAYRPQTYLMAMADVVTADRTEDGYLVGVAAGLPLLDGGGRRAAVDQARANVARLTQQEQDLALRIASEVTQEFLNVKAAEESVHTAEQALTAAREDYRVAQLRYTEGKGINVEVLDALATLVRAQTNHVQALFDFNVAQDRLQRATGQL
jgi:outer membrane protein TolC